jgi:hypothetical protein
MINYTIYSYWNITELAGVFNAVSALVYSDNYSGALKFIALVGVLSLSMCVFHGNWTLSPRQTGQSERSDAGVVFYS